MRPAGSAIRTSLGQGGTRGGHYRTADQLAEQIERIWAQAVRPEQEQGVSRRWAVCTGGEPLLQLDDALIAALHRRDFAVAVETNGTRAAPRGLNWICVSPKAGTDLVQCTGDELKLVYPQHGAPPERYAALDFRRFSLQPMDGPALEQNTRAALAYCLSHPQWHLSIQTHKFLRIR